VNINHSKPYVFEFEEMRLPSTTNAMARMHWATKLKERNSWNNVVMFWALKLGIPPSPLVKAKLTLTRCSSIEPDFDGLVSSFKFVIDSLITNAIIVNDRRANIGIPEYVWEKAPQKKGKIKVRVLEAA
jgi:hypothetical protein